MKYASLRQGLVGAWCPSLGATGYRLLDRSGYGNHGTLTNMDAGTDWVGGPRGTTLDFDGSNDSVIMDYIFPTLTKLTVSAWVRMSAGQAKLNGIIASSNGTSEPSWTFFVLGSFGNRPAFKVSGNWTNIGSGRSIVNEKWHHLAVTFSNSQPCTIWIDGEPETFSFSQTIAAASNKLTIGDQTIPAASITAFSGRIDDVRVYDKVFTPAEIRLLASEPGIGLRPERVSVYFGESLSSRRRKILTGLT